MLPHTKITELKALKRPELVEIWEALYQKPPPRGISKNFLIRGIAYRQQEITHGGLPNAVRTRLKKLSEALALNPNDFLRTTVKIKPGTRLYREYKGQNYEVEVLDQGFSYAGKQYKSLTAVAKDITGVQTNGHVFFGLKKDKRYVSP